MFKNSLFLFTHNCFGLRLDLSKTFWKALAIAVYLLSFRGMIDAYLSEIPITQNKKPNSLLNLLINGISARSLPQILSIKGEYTFQFSNFLIIGLCNSLAKSKGLWFVIFSFLTAPQVKADILSKKL